MEFLYESNKAFETEKIHLSTYFQEFRLSIETVPNTINMPKKKRKKKTVRTEPSLLGKNITTEEYKELANICSISKLKITGEPEQIPKVYLDGLLYTNENVSNENSCTLKTVKYLSERKSNFDSRHPNRIVLNQPGQEDDLRPYEHIVVVVDVCEPFRPTSLKHGGNYFAEIQLLGEQTLADLRDRIICPKDIEHPGDISEDPVVAQERKGKELFPSSFIFIEDVFYNDTRSLLAIDYSLEVRDWAKKQGVEGLQVKPMEKTKLESLTLRFGRPYVWVHMGNCEHLIIFRTARLLHPSDCLILGKYPLYTSLYRAQMRTCMMCQKLAAKWLVRDCDRLVYETTFLCHTCFNSFLYTNGKKVGDFKAYAYADRASVLA